MLVPAVVISLPSTSRPNAPEPVLFITTLSVSVLFFSRKLKAWLLLARTSIPLPFAASKVRFSIVTSISVCVCRGVIDIEALRASTGGVYDVDVVQVNVDDIAEDDCIADSRNRTT